MAELEQLRQEVAELRGKVEVLESMVIAVRSIQAQEVVQPIHHGTPGWRPYDHDYIAWNLS